MANALDYIAKRYHLTLDTPSPVEIPNVGRDILGEWFHDLGYTVGAEIGVERGLFSEVLLKANPDLTLHCIDAWQTYPGYKTTKTAHNLPEKYLETTQRLKDYQAILYREFSMRAVRKFSDNSLDFVYIDGNHALPWVMDDIIYWSEKVRPGGIVAGHDYLRRKDEYPTKLDVVTAVYWYTRLCKIKPWFLLGTKAEIPGQIRDKNRSWLWVKA